jgi:integrase
MPRRRGNGEGTIYQRKNGTWAGLLTIGRDENGKLKRLSFSGRTRKEVAEKLAKAKAELQQGTFVEPNKLTLGDWLDVWLKEYKKPTLRPEVFDTYEMIIRVHLKPALGSVLVQALRPEMVQRLYNEKAASGLSPATVRKIHQVLHGALKQAVRNQLVTRNVSEATTLPKAGQTREVRALTLEEQEKFLKALEGNRLEVAFKVLLGTGLRRGELLGLTWRDVNLTNGTITVRQSLIRAKGKLVIQDPKTKTSKRTIPLPDDLVAELKAHRARQAQEKLFAGPAYEDNNLVFANELGQPLDPRSFNRWFYELRDKAGLPKDVNLHALRHTYATRLLERGVSLKVIQRLMGHSKFDVTADIYSHVAPELEREAVAALNGLFKREKASSRS